jgi:hypothetical protein
MREMLIIGLPGAGKTMLAIALLRIARQTKPDWSLPTPSRSPHPHWDDLKGLYCSSP